MSSSSRDLVDAGEPVVVSVAQTGEWRAERLAVE